MIAYLKGTVLAKDTEYIILSVGDTGYKVHVAEKTHAALSAGDELEVFCASRIRQEEELELFGLPSFRALQLFDLVRGVSGIGPKAALAIVSQGEPEDLERAIAQGEEAFFRGVHGLGKKKIQKVIFELTGKMDTRKEQDQVPDEEVDALTSLGFSRQKAKEALSGVSAQDTEERIRQALKIIRR